MPDTFIADVSEFQGNVEAATYINAGHTIIICRVHNSSRADLMMPIRMAYLRAQRFVGIGWYQYLNPGADPVHAAQAFIGTIGHLGANEFCILDLEEGSGDQTGRAAEWFGVVDKWCGFPAMLYSGASFLANNLGGARHWPNRPIWIAAYGIDNGVPHTEPSEPHHLWQFSSRWQAPGIGMCDGSVYHDTAEHFMSTVRKSTPVTTPQRIHETMYVLACAQDGHADYIVSGDKAATITSQGELDGYTHVNIPVYVLPLPNYQKVCGILGVKA